MSVTRVELRQQAVELFDTLRRVAEDEKSVRVWQRIIRNNNFGKNRNPFLDQHLANAALKPRIASPSLSGRSCGQAQAGKVRAHLLSSMSVHPPEASLIHLNHASSYHKMLFYTDL